MATRLEHSTGRYSHTLEAHRGFYEERSPLCGSTAVRWRKRHLVMASYGRKGRAFAGSLQNHSSANGINGGTWVLTSFSAGATVAKPGPVTVVRARSRLPVKRRRDTEKKRRTIFPLPRHAYSSSHISSVRLLRSLSGQTLPPSDTAAAPPPTPLGNGRFSKAPIFPSPPSYLSPLARACRSWTSYHGCVARGTVFSYPSDRAVDFPLRRTAYMRSLLSLPLPCPLRLHWRNP